jgi:hypothetical protein
MKYVILIETATGRVESRARAAGSGVSSGNAVITASLPGSADVRFYIAVLPAGESTGTILPQYLTTSNNSIVIPAPGQTASASVT